MTTSAARPAEIFRDVCGYLGIDDAVAPQAVERRVKDKEIPVVPPSARRVLAPLKELVQPWRETRVFGAVRSFIARRLRYPPLTPELRERLVAHYADGSRAPVRADRPRPLHVDGGKRRLAARRRSAAWSAMPPGIRWRCQPTEPSGTRPAA